MLHAVFDFNSLQVISSRCVIRGPTAGPALTCILKLTSARLTNLRPPAAGMVELRDELARGFSLRVFASGRASWTFRYRPKSGGARRRIGLGEYPLVGLAEARRRADRSVVRYRTAAIRNARSGRSAKRRRWAR